MHLGRISQHLHTKEADASLNANMPWLQASGDDDGTPLEQHSQPPHFPAYVEQFPQQKRCEV